MVAELIGGAFLSASLQVLLDRVASRQVVDFFKRRKLDEGLLKDLQATMRYVNKLLNDAEEKQITDSFVKDWLDDLKDAFYEAEDFFDEIAYEDRRLELEAGTQSQTCTDQVRTFLFSLIPCKRGIGEMEPKLREICEKFERLLRRNNNVLHLGDGTRDKPLTQKPPTTCLPNDAFFHGREGDREAIVKLLLSADSNGKSLVAIPIVGMCGIGKTTLAQFVFNDDRVQKGFDLKAWVCISQDFNFLKLTKDILKNLGSPNCDNMTENGLQLELEEKLKGNKVLLVLDDLWSRDQDRWDFLLKPFKSVTQGSKVVVTTQDEDIVRVMQRAIPRSQNDASITWPDPIHLRELNDDDCWVLFKDHAFDGADPSRYPDLQGVGREIARKCKGLPLAAKTLGRLLCFEKDAEKWENILESHIWESSGDKILPALQLSYYCLPSHLKRCFAYCAIYPKDYEFSKEELICLWMAEGIIQPKGNKEMRKVGEEYFDDIVSRSLFQRSRRDESSFAMHGLVNDLAKVVYGDFCFWLEGDNSCKISGRTRHLSYKRTKKDSFSKFEGINKAQYLRTFLPLQQTLSAEIDSEVQHDLLPAFKRLRVLSLAQYRNVAELPNSIGYLKHLRYLDLQGTSIDKLPEFVSSLYNLQTLLLDSCKSLVELPGSIGNLKSLEFLNLRRTAIQMLPESMVNLSNLQTLVLSECENLIELPSNMGKLTKLHRLTDFFVGKQSGSGIEELGKLQNLRGKLCVRNLENAIPSEDNETAYLLNRQRLKELQLLWVDDSRCEGGVLEKLKPGKDVERLSIVGFGDTRFPDWIGSPSFSKMVFLEFSKCKHCTSLPPLGQLACLYELRIEACDLIEVLRPESFGTGKSKIRSLSFKDMEKWGEWNSDGVSFPDLQELHISGCPKLAGFLPSQLPALQQLHIYECPQLVASLPRAPTIRQMLLTDTSRSVRLNELSSAVGQPIGRECAPGSWPVSPEFSTYIYKPQLSECLHVSSLQRALIIHPTSPTDSSLSVGLNESPPALRNLHVNRFHSQDCLLQEIDKMGVSSVLQTIEIRDCHPLKPFSEELLFSKLEILEIEGCPNLESFGDFTANSLSVSGCPNVASLPMGRPSFPNLRKLYIINCSHLKWLPEGMHYFLPSLETLSIDNCPELESFPKGGLPCKLESLEIENCNKLICDRTKWGLQLLPSLSKFRIGYNEDLEIFPEENLLPSTLTSLEILGLGNLKYLYYGGLRQLTSIEKLSIYGCPKLESMAEEGLVSSKLQSLTIRDCNELVARRMQWDLWKLPSLSRFEIGACDDVESFPEETLLPSTLTNLEICLLKNLKSLNYKGLQHLTSLTKLVVCSCPNLQSIPEEGLPSSLFHFGIVKCDLLANRCEREKGEDWHKISCIPHIIQEDPNACTIM